MLAQLPPRSSRYTRRCHTRPQRKNGQTPFGPRRVTGSIPVPPIQLIPFFRDCSQDCSQGAEQHPTHVDNSGISAQPTTTDGRSWTTCPLLRIRRLGSPRTDEAGGRRLSLAERARSCSLIMIQIWAQCSSASLQPRPAAPRPDRRQQGCCGIAGSRGGFRPGPARGRRGCARIAVSPRPVARQPDTRPRDCCGRSGCGGGSRPGPVRGRRGCARAAGWPRPAAPRPGRHQQGCCGRAGCRGGFRPGPARGRRR